jgi:hypothetical protein
VYRPVKDKVRPQSLGLLRLMRIRPTRRSEAFAAVARAEIRQDPA